MITSSAVSTWTTGPANFVARHRVMAGDGYSEVNHEDTSDELAIWTTRLFLGVDTECISCHVMYAGGGRLIDLLGTRRGFPVIMVAWSLACAAHALATGFLMLAAFRFLLGMGEGGGFPAATKAVAE